MMKYLKSNVLILLFLNLFSCNNPEIILLCENSNDNNFREVYLIKNPPNTKSSLYKLILSFNSELKDINQYGKRVFLKPHDNSFNDFILNEKVDYSKSKCQDIDNKDIICEVNKYKLYYNGQDTITYYYFQ